MDPQQFNSEVRRRALEWRAEQEAAFHRKVREGPMALQGQACTSSAAQQAAAEPQLPSCTASCQICTPRGFAGGRVCCVNKCTSSLSCTTAACQRLATAPHGASKGLRDHVTASA